MKVKQTIAFIGEAGKICGGLVEKLAAAGNPVLLIGQADKLSGQGAQQILKQIPNADIEEIDCAREGCWEADVIVFCGAASVETAVSEKIKEVANQKIMVYVSDQELDETEKIGELKKSFPHSEWVQLHFDSATTEMHISGPPEARATIENMLA